MSRYRLLISVKYKQLTQMRYNTATVNVQLELLDPRWIKCVTASPMVPPRFTRVSPKR